MWHTRTDRFSARPLLVIRHTSGDPLEQHHKPLVIIQREDIQTLVDALIARGYAVMGPVERDGAVVYRQIGQIADLPIGRVDEQTAGRYRLVDGDERSLFAYVVGPDSWKQFLHRPAVRLFTAERTGQDFEVRPEPDEEPQKLALFGARSCELSAIAIQDRVFLEGAYVDPHYHRRREGLFVVAVNCARAGGSCFCVSTGTGPAARSGFDLALTEVVTEEGHHFVVEVGSEAGAVVIQEVPHTLADAVQVDTAARLVEQTAQSMGKTMETDGLKELLASNPDHPRWDEVAQRCLACGNCTMVCPTCFCTSVEDVTDLAGVNAERWRKWDSCFTLDFTHIHGGSARQSDKSRYRQWITHKLSTWVDQFGTSGCVGCGRCVTWCPVGIDIREEVAAIRASDTAGATTPERKGHHADTQP